MAKLLVSLSHTVAAFWIQDVTHLRNNFPFTRSALQQHPGSILRNSKDEPGSAGMAEDSFTPTSNSMDSPVL